jgi:hypothetical protein
MSAMIGFLPMARLPTFAYFYTSLFKTPLMYKKCMLALLTGLLSTVLCAQKTGKRPGAAAPAEPLKLACPMENMKIGDPPQGDYKLGTKDLKVMLSSATDTAIRSSVNGKVFSVTPGEDKKFEIALYYRDYYIWIVGVNKPLVKKNDVIKPGQLLGLVTPGNEVEFMLFLNEEPMDPRKYLDCPVQQQN